MTKFDPRTNTLEPSKINYELQDVAEPNLFRDVFTYEDVPKAIFDHRHVAYDMPQEIWITDTTFRDGQQSRAPYTTAQIVELYKKMHRLGGPKGLIRQCEFFLYSEWDREALRKCMELGYEFPEITGWIRATQNDFELAKSMHVKECGILTSCSDYHIFKKLKKTRKQAMDGYLTVIKEALEAGIRPRCHFEDITRADYYGFVLPFALEIKKLSEESGIPIKIRACDTLGYGIPHTGTSLPRSVPGIIYGFKHLIGFPSEQLEWHGHNDFYKSVINATSAWLFGASGVNCSLLGIGERTGNTPLEAMVIEYAQIRGTLDGMDTTVITEIADYYRNELNTHIPHNTPFVGKNFNVTQAGIHADGLLKDEEIYNIFDTKKLLKRPAGVAINQTSGLAGLAHWLNNFWDLTGDHAIGKNHPLVAELKTWVDQQYTARRVTAISDVELEEVLKELTDKYPEYHPHNGNGK